MKYIQTKEDFINEKKSYQLNEGQFSWMTQDSNKQIGSEKQNTIDVYMYDNEGNKWKETRYDGYGNFGGMDFYDLVATMNGYDADRQKGIDLAFGKLKTKDKKRKTLFPALVENPRYNWKRHDFTEQPENDPNQSWYQEEEDDRYGYDDYYESVDESTAKNVLKDAINALTKTFAGKKLNKEYIKDYIKSIEMMARKNPMDFVKDYGEFANDDWIEDVRYNMANEKVNEGKAEDATVEKAIVAMVDSMIKAGKTPGQITKHLKSQVPYKITTNAIRKLIDRKEIKPGEWLNEGKYSVHYSDGIRSGKEFRNERDAMKFAKDLIKNKKGLQNVSVHKPGMSQTADKEDLLAWWGGGSYWDNVSKKDKDVAKLKIEGKINEGRVAADRLLKDVVKGNTSAVEGIKLSKEMAQGFLDWLQYSTYGKKYGKLPFYMLFTAAFNWGLDRFVKGANTKLKSEFKELKAKAKEMSKEQMKRESLNEGKGDKAVSMAQKKLDKVMADLKANLLKFKGAKTDGDKETFKTEAGRLTKLRKDAQNNLEQAIQDAYADVDLVVMENYDTEQRKEMAAKGLALPDGSFPIKNLEDLKNAIQAYGRAKDHAKAAKFIAKRAKALGADDLIPDTEDFQKALKEASFGKIPKFGK